MKKSKVVPMVDENEQARRRFSQHVQSVAFNLTLSRTMIDMLAAVRDYGFPYVCGPRKTKEEDWKEYERYRSVARSANGAHKFVPCIDAVMRRGLVIRTSKELNSMLPGEPVYRLSRSGEIVCDLLVESGLIAPAAKPEKAKRRG